MKSNQYFSRIKRKATQALVGLASVLSLSQASDVPVQVEKPAYEVRGYFKMLDAEGNEVRHLAPGQTNTLQLRAQIQGKLELPAAAFNFTYDFPLSLISGFSAVPFQEGEHYENDIFAQGGDSPVYEMQPRGNKVYTYGGSRATKIASGKERLGPVEGEGNLAQVLICAKATNLTTTVISGKFTVFDSDSDKKPTRTRAFRVAIVPQDYAGRQLISDVNDGEEPANDFTSLDMFGQTVNYVRDGRVAAPEPFMVGKGILYRSTEGAAGPWTSVYTNTLPAAAFSDRAMKGKTAFYRYGELDQASAKNVKKGQ